MIACHGKAAVVTDLSLRDNLEFVWSALSNGYLQALVVHHCTLVVAIVVQQPGPEVILYQI